MICRFTGETNRIPGFWLLQIFAMWSRIRILSDLEPADWNRIKICIHLNQAKDKLNFSRNFHLLFKLLKNMKLMTEKDKKLKLALLWEKKITKKISFSDLCLTWGRNRFGSGSRSESEREVGSGSAAKRCRSRTLIKFFYVFCFRRGIVNLT